MNPLRSTVQVLSLALADLRHERLMTLCLILACASVLAPILILLGLKHGAVSTLRGRLVEDPVYRELRPQATQRHDQAWFDAMRADPRVAFVVPGILPTSATVRARARGGGPSINLDLLPSAAGDPLLLENGGIDLAAGTCALSTVAARRLGVGRGDEIDVLISRYRNAKREQQRTRLRVAAVLSARATPLERIYTTLDFVEAVENYREGLAVPERNWPGEDERPYLSFDGLVLLTPALAPSQQRSLIMQSGFSQVRELDHAAFEERFDFTPPPELRAYELRPSGGAIRHDAILALQKRRLRGQAATLLGFVDQLSLQPPGQQKALTPVAISLNPEQAERLDTRPTPWGAMNPHRAAADLRQIALPATMTDALAADDTLRVQASGMDFALSVVADSKLQRPRIPIALAGILRTARDRAVRFDPQRGGFALQRLGYRSFRLYARSIDDVSALAATLEAQQIPSIARLDEIERVRTLDRNLTRIFWLVTSLSIVGGALAFMATLWASVRRKQRDIAVLRLMGFTRSDVMLFPVAQALALGLLIALLATASYWLGCQIINAAFAAQLGLGEKLCQLPPQNLGHAMLLTLGAALLGSTLAARASSRIDPATAIRDE